MATALFQGASIGPLIDLAIQIDPRYMSLGRFSYVCFYLYLDLCCKLDVGVHIFGHSAISVFVKWCYSLLMAVVFTYCWNRTRKLIVLGMMSFHLEPRCLH